MRWKRNRFWGICLNVIVVAGLKHPRLVESFVIFFNLPFRILGFLTYVVVWFSIRTRVSVRTKFGTFVLLIRDLYI